MVAIPSGGALLPYSASFPTHIRVLRCGRVGGGGAGSFHDPGGDGGSQQVIQELMRQPGAAAFAQDTAQSQYNGKPSAG